MGGCSHAVSFTSDNRLLQVALDRALDSFVGRNTKAIVFSRVSALHEELEFEDGKTYAFPSIEAVNLALQDLFGTPSLFIAERIKASIEREISACKCDACLHSSRTDCISNKCQCCDLEDEFAVLARAETPR